ncbi:MAG: protein kinase domain-containing protein [Myxococcaceae bacterium]
MQRLTAGPVTHLQLSGIIDETFNPALLTRDMVGHTIVDVGRVERISSFGVRKWIELTSKLPEQVSGLYVIHAPPLVVDQLNMVEGFAGVAKVLSVLAPYTCGQCREDRLRVVDVRVDAQNIADGSAPDHICPVCQSHLEFADQPAEFFDYLRHQSNGPINSTVSHYLQTLRPSTSAPLTSHVKLIKDDITFIRVSSALKGDLNTRRLTAGIEGRVAYDFGNVTVLEPEAVPKLEQVLDAAADGAHPFLWRVPPLVLLALAATRRTYRVGLLTLLLPCECRNCGNRTTQRIHAGTYAQELEQGKALTTLCQICGGNADMPLLRDALDFLRAHATRNPPLEDELETLEPRALSQYLAGIAAQDAEAHPDQGAEATGQMLGSSLKLEILRRLGQGGMAEVFLARQVGLKGFEKYVVVKKILESLAQSQDFVEMLFAEARANARLTHPNIVQTYDVGMMDGLAFITMEYVRGPDVKKLLVMMRRAGIQLPIEHALRIVAETAAGLHYAHSYVDPTGKPHPVVHRDISPHNILVSLDGAIKLSDFGIAKVQGENENTRPGTFKGKIAYVSPETVSCQPLDARNDVFSLGVVLFELLTGTLPFRRESEAAVLRAIVHEPPPDPSQLNSAIPPDVSAIVLRALEKNPARRIQTAGQLREEIEAAMLRNRLQSSPGAVARFFEEKLTEALAEFGPSNRLSNPGLPRMAALAPEDEYTEVAIHSDPGQPSPFALNLPFEVPTREPEPRRRSGPSRSLSGQPKQDPDEPITAAAAPIALAGQKRLDELNQVRRSQPPFLAPPNASSSVSAPGLRPSSSSAPGVRPSGSSLSAPGVRPSGSTSSSAPGMRPRSAAEARSHTRRAYLKSIVGGISVGAIAAVIAAIILRNASPDHIAVHNLAAGEQLYVSGVRVNPEVLRRTEDGPLVVSTARKGKLHRYGTLDTATEINIQALIEASGSSLENQTGTLRVSGSPEGCEVELGNQRLPAKTPLETTITAARETLLTVSCSSKRTIQHWIMAAPGQVVSVNVSEDAS